MTKQKSVLDNEEVQRTARQRIDKLIRSHKTLRKEVAEAINMLEQVFSDKMTGRRNFTLKDLVALADVFEVSIDYLTGRIDTPWPDPWNKTETVK